MKLSTSMASSGPSSSSFSSASSNANSVHSFGRFLDLITPAEFSKLLRARVRHLLSTWPPRTESIPSSSTSIYSSREERHSSPPLESIEAFAAFFRSQDSQPPSPTNASSATSLSTLHHNLLALQTLLSILSGRELKDIVRARLAEGGKDRSAAVQGLMDVMRNPGEGEIDDSTEGGDAQQALVGREDIRREGETGIADHDAPVDTTSPVPPSVSMVGERKIPLKGLGHDEISTSNDGQPPKKRQRIYPTGKLGVTSTHLPPALRLQLQEFPHSPLAHPHPQTTRISSSMSPTSLSSSPLDLSLRSLTVTGGLRGSGDDSAPLTPNSMLNAREDLSKPILSNRSSARTLQSANIDYESVPKVMNPADTNSGFPDQETRISEARDDAKHRSRREIEGLVVTQPEDEMAQVSRPQGAPYKTRNRDMETGYVQWRGPRDRSPTAKVEQGRSKLVASEIERDLPAEFATPPNNLQRIDCDDKSGMYPDVADVSTDEGSQPVSETNDIVVDADTSPRLSTVAHMPLSPVAYSRASRSRSRSFHRSISDRASPPGPMLRTAVDWASGVSPAVDVVSEDTLAFTSSSIFNPEQEIERITPGMFAPKTFLRSTHRDWDAEGGQPSEPEINADGRIEQRRKLFIRLPARPKTRLAESGIRSESSITSPSASGSRRISPVPEHGAKKSPTVQAVHETHLADASSFRERVLQRSESAPDMPKPASASGSSSNVTPSAGTTSNIVAPRAQHPVQNPPGSRPQSGSSGAARNPYALSTNPYALPTNAYPGQPHPYPGPWIGAMFYVPYRGRAHAQSPMQQPAKVPSGPSRQPSDVTTSGRTGGEDHASSSSAPAAAAASPSSTQPPGTRKKGLKRATHDSPEHLTPPPPVLDPDVTYTDDIGVKESATVKRRCYNCRGIQAPSWRKSKLTFGKILCNKCGIYESTHMMARPLKTRPRRSQVGADGESTSSKKRKAVKKLSVVP